MTSEIDPALAGYRNSAGKLLPAFTEVAEALGGYLEIEGAPKPLADYMKSAQALLDGLITDASAGAIVRGGHIDVEGGYLQDESFNAFAHIQDGVDVIGVNVGILYRLQALFNLLIIQPTSFPEVGDLKSRPKLGTFDLQDMIGGVAFVPPQFQPPSPEATLIYQLIKIGIEFVHAHELGHLKNGHVDWLHQRYGLTAFSELAMSSVPGLSGIDLQTLEFDADCSGAQYLVNKYCATTPRSPDDFAHMTVPENGQFGTFGETVKRLAFALYACCKMFQDSGTIVDVEELLLSSHPPAQFRMKLVSEFIIQVLHETGDVAVEDIIPHVVQGVVEAEVAWSKAFGVPRHDMYAPENLAITEELLGRYSANWTILHPQLDLLKRFGKLAPAVTDFVWKTRNQ